MVYRYAPGPRSIEEHRV